MPVADANRELFSWKLCPWPLVRLLWRARPRRVLANRTVNRHAALYRQRARELIDQAWDIPSAEDSRHMLELAAIYQRAADSLAPTPPPSPSSQIFCDTK